MILPFSNARWSQQLLYLYERERTVNYRDRLQISVTTTCVYCGFSLCCKALGAVPSPFDCYLCNRGLKTLHLRMRQHFKNALAVAIFLEADPRVDRVIFPGE